MSEKIELDVAALKTQLDKLNKAINEFEPYSKEFLKSAINQFDQFNSDFISEIEKTLDSMGDTKAPELAKAVKEYSKLIQETVDGFSNIDQGYANQIERKG